ncbi:MAG TPA: archaeosine biosynthesis radical SAM protein RaSEA [Thermoplasmata archaeon]|nr:archaeosine biosynthesis radical SAM protein RaSEA [Thermoplasmata archaeon]
MRLQQIVKDERHPHDFDPREYISTWTEKDLLHGKVVDAWVIIFRTRGCYWAQASGCSMCGYVNDVAREVSVADLGHQLDSVLRRHTGQPLVKVYTSGNFFDDHEVVPEMRDRILKELGDRCDKVIVETLSHLLRKDQLEHAMTFVDALEVAFGLESTNPRVLRESVNKVWGLDEHARAARLCHEAGATVKTYLLIKPPFLTEREAIEDAVTSGHEADPYSDTISFNPVNVQSRTLVDRLFRRGEYRPPWLWSVVEVLERTRDLKAHVKSHPTAGGMIRGAHNCGTCDRKVVDAIEEFSLTLRTDFADLSCECRALWREYADIQEFMRTPADPRFALES